MTLLVGILATDGVVVAADRAVTFGDGQRSTIADTRRKIEILSGSVIVVGTGQVGLGQRFTAIVSHVWSGKLGKDKNGKELKMPVESVDAGTFLSRLAVQDFGSTGAKGGSYGALVAFANSKGPHLIEFAVADFQPQFYTPDVPYVSMGSGQSLADPYLALLRRCVWTAGAPTVAEATFAAYWVMHQAIEAAPGGIGEPIDIAVVRKKNASSYEAVFLTEAEIEEHKNRAQSANVQLAQALKGETAQAPPAPPEPPALGNDGGTPSAGPVAE